MGALNPLAVMRVEVTTTFSNCLPMAGSFCANASVEKQDTTAISVGDDALCCSRQKLICIFPLPVADMQMISNTYTADTVFILVIRPFITV